VILAAKLYRIFALVTFAGALTAQAQIVGANLSGSVHDASGASVAGATVVVRQAETGATRTLLRTICARRSLHGFRGT
jgi:hypothetical protein